MLRSGFIGWAIMLISVAYSSNSFSVELETSEVRHKDGVYTVKYSALLDAPHEQVFNIASDFNNYKLLSPSVTQSEILEDAENGHIRVRLLIRSCAAMICKTLNKVSDVTLTPLFKISSQVVKSQSSFEELSEELLLAAVPGQKTRLQYKATVNPDFFVPPVIGPWLAMRLIKRELTISTRRIEKKASDIKP